MCKVILKHRNPNRKFKCIILSFPSSACHSWCHPKKAGRAVSFIFLVLPALLYSLRTLVGILTRGFSNSILFSVFSHEYIIGSYSDSNSLQSSSPILGNVVDSA